MRIQEFIDQEDITLHAERTSENPFMNSDIPMRHWDCALSRDSSMMHVVFSQGMGHTKAPIAADVLYCLASDASGVENAGDFISWAEEMGLDTDSRAAERTYLTVRTQAEDLVNLLGRDRFNQLLECEED